MCLASLLLRLAALFLLIAFLEARRSSMVAYGAQLCLGLGLVGEATESANGVTSCLGVIAVAQATGLCLADAFE